MNNHYVVALASNRDFEEKTMTEEPRRATKFRHADACIGLALGSGSARGLAHIGVIQALEEADIKVDVIAGTSIGALIGAVYASDSLDSLESTFQELDWMKIASFFDVVFPRSGLIDGAKVSGLVRTHIHVDRIEALPRRFASLATDIFTGEEVIISSGDVIEAVRASISVPGIFTPVRSNGRILVDGGLVNPVPVSVARSMGADIVIAVDLNHDIVEGKNFKPFANHVNDEEKRRLASFHTGWTVTGSQYRASNPDYCPMNRLSRRSSCAGFPRNHCPASLKCCWPRSISWKPASRKPASALTGLTSSFSRP